jgi:hypothetical protein
MLIKRTLFCAVANQVGFWTNTSSSLAWLWLARGLFMLRRLPAFHGLSLLSRKILIKERIFALLRPQHWVWIFTGFVGAIECYDKDFAPCYWVASNKFATLSQIAKINLHWIQQPFCNLHNDYNK